MTVLIVIRSKCIHSTKIFHWLQTSGNTNIKVVEYNDENKTLYRLPHDVREFPSGYCSNTRTVWRIASYLDFRKALLLSNKYS